MVVVTKAYYLTYQISRYRTVYSLLSGEVHVAGIPTVLGIFHAAFAIADSEGHGSREPVTHQAVVFLKW